MPIALALVAGALATVNPCGFPLLPAYLSFYVGADEAVLPRAPARVAQGLLVGVLVSGGFLGVFAAVGFPVAYGMTQLTSAIPWAGLAIGILMIGASIVGLAGRAPYLGLRRPAHVGRRKRPTTMVWFGAAYAVCSLGCTLPIFVAVVGASLATATIAEGTIVFAAYGLGTATMLIALSLGAALARAGVAARLKQVRPHMEHVAFSLLLIAGAYVAYYWTRVLWSRPDTLAADPLVGGMTRFATLVTRAAGSSGGRATLLAAGFVVAIGIAAAMWQWSGRRKSPSGAGE